MSRRKAREVAFQMLYQMSEGANERTMAELTLAEAGLPRESAKFAAELSHGAWEHRFEIAEYIKKFISGWQLERLFSVDRELLHLAIYELKYGSEPQAVVINETVELAKLYGNDDSSKFVNAVLDNFRKKVIEQNLPEYQPDEAAMEQARAAENERLAKLVPEEEPIEEPKQEPQMPITEKMEKKGFRKIARAEQTEDDKILPEPDDEEEDEFGRPVFRREGERKFGDNKFADKKFGERKFSDKKFSDNKFSDRKFSDRKPFEKRDGERKFGDKKFGDKKFSDRKFSDKKFGDKKFGDKKFSDRKKFENKKFDNKNADK